MSFSDLSNKITSDPPEGAPIDTTTARFRADVLEASMRRVVLVDFWAPGAIPAASLRQLWSVWSRRRAARFGWSR